MRKLNAEVGSSAAAVQCTPEQQQCTVQSVLGSVEVECQNYESSETRGLTASLIVIARSRPHLSRSPGSESVGRSDVLDSHPRSIKAWRLHNYPASFAQKPLVLIVPATISYLVFRIP